MLPLLTALSIAPERITNLTKPKTTQLRATHNSKDAEKERGSPSPGAVPWLGSGILGKQHIGAPSEPISTRGHHYHRLVCATFPFWV